jgi:predicted transcriptional regulator
MPRLSIELTPEQHKRLKAIAALRGQSIKDYVLQRSLESIPSTEQEALQQLDALLRGRVEEAETGRVVSKSASEIFETVQKTR